MKIAIVGSRSISNLNLENYIKDADEIVSGGAVGVDSLAAAFAKARGIKLTEFLPDYKRYGKSAPIVRNKQIVDYSDFIIVFWDGYSKGSKFVIEYAKAKSKPCEVIIYKQ